MSYNIDNILDYIPDSLKKEVRFIIEHPDVSVAEKKKHLGDILKTSPTLLKQCEEFLDKMNEPDYSKPDIFIKLIEVNFQRTMAEERVERKDIPALEAIIVTQSQAVKDAYKKWKECYIAEQKIGGSKMAIDSTKINIVPPAEVFEKLPDETNIVMMGATGTGKSTFINAFVNYMKFPTLEAAEAGELEILIKAHFLETDSDLKQSRVNLDPTISPENGADSANESDGVGEAATQFPKSYIFKWGLTGQEKLIRIIDTPGVGDCRGIDQEQINMDRILRFLSNFKQLHAICIVVKSNEARKTATFRYCLNQLLTHLHISACKNIMFVFTNCGTNGFGPGDSYATLKEMIQDVKKEKKDVELSLDGNNIFCFESDNFRYLCVKKVGNMFFTSAERNRFVTSWQKSSEATLKLLGRIASKDIPPHLLFDTLSVNNIRAMITAIAKPSAEISRVQLMNIEMLKEKQAEIKVNAIDINYPMTVCRNKKCVDYKKDFRGKVGAEIIYKTICHDHCRLENVPTGQFPCDELKNCAAMNRVYFCTNCHCSYKDHMHITYKQEVISETLNLNANEAQEFINKINKRKDALEAEAKKIKEYCAEFALFVRKNSVRSCNDAYCEFIDYLIKVESDKVANKVCIDDTLQNLRKFREEYTQYLNYMAEQTGQSTKTLDTLYQMIEELKQLEFSGPYLQIVQKLTVKQEEIQGHTLVPVKIGNNLPGGSATRSPTFRLRKV